MCTTCAEIRREYSGEQPEELTAAPLSGYAPLRVDMDNPDAVRDMQIVAAYCKSLSLRKAAESCGVSHMTVQRVLHRLGNTLLTQLDKVTKQ